MAEPSAKGRAATPNSPFYYIHTAICLGLMFGFGQLPPVQPLTPLGMSITGIFLGALYGWIFIEIIWPSLAGLLALMLIGGMKPVQLFNKSFGDPIVQMMFFIFIFCATINHYGLSKFISLWFITRKFIKGRPWLFTFIFLCSILVLGALTSASPAAIIGWSILYGICNACGYEKGDNYPTMMVFGIVFAASLGMAIIPFKQAPLTILGIYSSMSGTQMDYGKYMLLTSIICLACVLAFIVIGKYIFRPDMSKLLALKVEDLNSGSNLHLDKIQKIVLIFLFLLVILLLAPNFLPADFPVAAFLRAIGSTGTVLLLVTIMAAVKIDGKPLLNFKVMADAGVAWGIVLLLALVQPLSALMASAETGITAFLMNAMQPVFSIGTPMTFALIVGFITMILCQVMNNAATGVAMMPIILSYCTASGASPDLALVMVVISCHIAFLTPAASPNAALLHGNDWCDARSIWKTAPLVILAAWLIIAGLAATLGTMIF